MFTSDEWDTINYEITYKMKIKSLLILIVFALNSCGTAHDSESNRCNVNLNFEKKFFKNIAVVEEYTREHKTIGLKKSNIKTDAAMDALQFLSRYVKVSPRVMSYEFGYPSFELFEADKKDWLTWYNTNRCSILK